MKLIVTAILTLLAIGGVLTANMDGGDWFTDEPSSSAETCKICNVQWDAYKTEEGREGQIYSGLIQFTDYRKDRVTFTLYANSASNKAFLPAVYYQGNMLKGGIFTQSNLDTEIDGTWKDLKYRPELNLVTFSALYPDGKTVKFRLRNPRRVRR